MNADQWRSISIFQIDRLSVLTHIVIAGLDPAIHPATAPALPIPAWIAGSSPAMTPNEDRSQSDGRSPSLRLCVSAVNLLLGPRAEEAGAGEDGERQHARDHRQPAAGGGDGAGGGPAD